MIGNWLRSRGAPGSPTIVARLHGTVELERALAERGFDPGLAGRAVLDPHLGARVVVVDGPEGPLAIAEPATEGRLAGSLARHGEGFRGVYLRSPVALDEVNRPGDPDGLFATAAAAGPFGPQVLVLHDDRTEGHVLLVAPRAVPSPR